MDNLQAADADERRLHSIFPAIYRSNGFSR